MDSAPPATPTTICLSFPLENPGRKLCKEDIFLSENGISLQKNIANPPRMSPDLILQAVLRAFLTSCIVGLPGGGGEEG